LVSDKEASELEELLALFKLGLGETEQFAAALQVNNNNRGRATPNHTPKGATGGGRGRGF